MRKPGPVTVWSAIGLAGFGALYDTGLFGKPDGRDHSALFVMSTNTVSSVTGVIVTANNTGEMITLPMSDLRPPQTEKA
jgi:hypothetical protein